MGLCSTTRSPPSLNKEDLYKVVMNPDQAQRKGHIVGTVSLGVTLDLHNDDLLFRFFLVYLEMCRQ
jgi:hypothetical protein